MSIYKHFIYQEDLYKLIVNTPTEDIEDCDDYQDAVSWFTDPVVPTINNNPASLMYSSLFKVATEIQADNYIVLQQYNKLTEPLLRFVLYYIAVTDQIKSFSMHFQSMAIKFWTGK